MESNVFCGACKTPLAEPLNLPPENRRPCPLCGKLHRAKHVALYAELSFHSSIQAKGERPGFTSGGKHRPIVELFAGDDQSGDGTWATVSRMIDRVTKRYYEYVILSDGTVSRNVQESLPDHWGHGSAKFHEPKQ